jgi:hypothetical protein
MAKTSSVSITRFIKRVDRLEAFVSDEAFDALDEIGRRATDFMRNRIESRGTSFSARAQRDGLNRGPGRVRTGAMIDGIDYRETSRGGGETGSRLSIQFGYFNTPPSRGYPNVSYVTMQEEGFAQHWKWYGDTNSGTYPAVSFGSFSRSGVPRGLKYVGYRYRTEGTFAFRDAKEYVINIVRPIVAGEASKKIAQRMRGT